MKKNNFPQFKGKFSADYKEKLYNYFVNEIGINDTKIYEAYNMAFDGHQGQMRKAEKNMPYITHPVSVAIIVAKEMNLDKDCIIAALLHDVIEDTNYSAKDIKEKFGEKIETIVKGVTKITKKGGQNQPLETLKNMIMSFLREPEVILIKIADRLHNMRTMDNMPTEKQKAKSEENLNIYSPLAYSAGLYEIKKELEDLSFQYLYPMEYQWIKKRIDELKKQTASYYTKLKKKLQTFITENINVPFEIKYEYKSYYSTYKKLRKKRIENPHYDIKNIHNYRAIRIIFDTTEIENVVDIFLQQNKKQKILEIINKKDWITNPKDNGFKAMVLDCQVNHHTIEIQLISKKDEIIANKGLYHLKNLSILQNKFDKEILKEEFLTKEICQNFYQIINPNIISVFTPKDDIIRLPKGATVLDFAYYIHEEIGHNALGAIIDEEYTKGISYELKNGEKVKIITSKYLQVNEKWLKIAKTSRAKRAIRKIIKKSEKISKKISPDLSKNEPLIITKNIDYKTAPCCNVIPYEKAIAVQDELGLIFIHREKCPEVQHYKKQVPVVWQDPQEDKHYATINIKGVDKPGTIKEISHIITEKHKVNMKKFFMFATEGGFEGYIEMEVMNIDTLNQIIKELAQNEYITIVKRLIKFNWNKLLKNTTKY